MARICLFMVLYWPSILRLYRGPFCYAREESDGIVSTMKRTSCVYLLLGLALLLGGCSSVKQDQALQAPDAAYALTEVVKLASQSIDVNLFADTMLEVLLPPQTEHFLQMQEIPLFHDHLDVWRMQVLSAFRQVVVQLPSLVEASVSSIVWQDAEATLKEGNRSATTRLVTEQGTVLAEQVRSMLQEALKTSDITWDLILDRYGIWQESTALWGREELPVVAAEPFEHLYSFFTTTYLDELGTQEERLRTTPVPKGSGSFLEIFQQDGRQ